MLRRAVVVCMAATGRIVTDCALAFANASPYPPGPEELKAQNLVLVVELIVYALVVLAFVAIGIRGLRRIARSTRCRESVEATTADDGAVS